MYGQGNFSPQFGQGSHTPMPPFQQRPVVPPPPPFQKGHPTLQHSTIQQGPPSIPPCAGYSGSFVYRHAPPPTVQQGQPVHGPTSEMLNAGQSYLPPPPPPQPPPPTPTPTNLWKNLYDTFLSNCSAELPMDPKYASCSATCPSSSCSTSHRSKSPRNVPAVNIS
ncbi:formin-like protein 20 [Camellia sinensis]|uniref:formin-like protein 20 n=1 Tax=Camellia sinensis TaxID=4442 RepID=UPI0010369649|nr:formin-like protein 20 [Camellia sinensis]